ncbi:20455_t:CDS:1, partial [Racocetra persica]
KKSQTCVKNDLHKDDINQVLKLFSRWLSNLSYSENKNQKKEVVLHIIKLLENQNTNELSSTNTTNCLSSLLLIKTAMKINAFDYYLSTDKKYIKADETDSTEKH